MIFEIETIEPGDKEEDVVVLVNYYDESTKEDPFFVEHHEIFGIPEQVGYPKLTPRGQFIGLDDSVVSPWIVVDGEIKMADPYEFADQIQWEEPSEEYLILGPVRGRALEVKELHPEGEDKLPPKTGTFGPSNIRKLSSKYQGLIGYTEEV